MEVLPAAFPAANSDKTQTEDGAESGLKAHTQRQQPNGEGQASHCEQHTPCGSTAEAQALPNGNPLQNGHERLTDTCGDVGISAPERQGDISVETRNGVEDGEVEAKQNGPTTVREASAGQEAAEVDPASSELLTEEKLRETERLLRQHSGCGGPWRLFRSALGGRGLVATRALTAGELVLRDPPLVLAPRAASAPVCLRCHRRAEPARLQPCKRCCMPVCCEDGGAGLADHHAGECALLAEWGARPPADGGWPRPVVRACAAVRCLALPAPAQRLLAALQAHHHPRYRHEVEVLSRLCGGRVPAAALSAAGRAMRALDTNAFETPLDGSRRPEALGGRLRGLYPLAAMMNHQCSPNTTHGYDAGHAMVVRAAVDIAEGEELTNSYAPLLWGTAARRAHLIDTKGFLCSCDRCRDPQEFGSLLSALRCLRGGCPGPVVSEAPLDPSSAGRCLDCGRRLDAAGVRAVQTALGALLARVDASSPHSVAAHLRSPRVVAALHPNNQVAVELKSCLVWLYGHADGHGWAELSDEDLQLKESLCRELLRLLELARVGRCRLRGLFLYELHCTLSEKMRRRPSNSVQAGEADPELLECLEDAADIFRLEAMAPPDLYSRLEALKASAEAGDEACGQR